MRPEQYKIDFEKMLYALELSESTIKQIQGVQTRTKEGTQKILWESRFQMNQIDKFCMTESYYLLDPHDRKILSTSYIKAENYLYENAKR